MSAYEEAAGRAAFGLPTARKSGRAAWWPHVPVLRHVPADGAPYETQILGRAFATRDEAVAFASSYVERQRAVLAERLADPCKPRPSGGARPPRGPV